MSHLRRFARDYARPVAPSLLAAELCMGVVAAATAAQAQLVEPLVNRIFVDKRADLLWPIAGAVVLAFLVKAAASMGQAALLETATQRVLARVRGDLYGRVVRADLRWFGTASPGDLLARLMHDAAQLKAAFVAVLVGVGRHASTLLLLVGVMLYQDWRLTLMAVVAYPLAIAPIVRIGRRVRRAARARNEAVAEVTARVAESLDAVRLVKAHGAEAVETARVAAALDDVRRETVRATFVGLLRHPVMELLGGLAVGAVLVYAGGEVIAGERSSGSLFAFLTALLLAYEPVKGLARINLQLQEGVAAAERVYGAIDVEPTIVDGPRTLDVERGEVRLEGVRFAHGDTEILDGVDFVAPAGATVALVGVNGAGKSTLLDLVARLLDPDAGRVLIDGQDVRDVTLASLRRNVCLVTQRVLLLDDTLRANVAYACPEASDEAVQRALELVGLDDFDPALRLGPGGCRLSGGERQRVALARAALRDAPVLLLDEAGAALDARGEAALTALCTARTAIIVAHRLSTIAYADRVYVLDGGVATLRDGDAGSPAAPAASSRSRRRTPGSAGG